MFISKRLPYFFLSKITYFILNHNDISQHSDTIYSHKWSYLVDFFLTQGKNKTILYNIS